MGNEFFSILSSLSSCLFLLFHIANYEDKVVLFRLLHCSSRLRCREFFRLRLLYGGLQGIYEAGEDSLEFEHAEKARGVRLWVVNTGKRY